MPTRYAGSLGWEEGVTKAAIPRRTGYAALSEDRI